MHNVLKKLTPEQALEVLMRLSDSAGAIQDAVLAEARNVLGEIDLDEIAGQVFYVLDSIDVHDCWDRAGSSRDGYTSPEEAAVELIDEELRPFLEQAGRYHELAMGKEQATYCMGVILGLYRYEHEATSEFREWALDMPIQCAGALLADWRERGPDSTCTAAMDVFIGEHCPNWAASLLRSAGRR